MAERGATPKVPALRRRALRAVRSLFTPLLPDDYLELINPLWSTRSCAGGSSGSIPRPPDAVTVLIRPGYEWPGHRPGQYLRIGVVVDGVHHWRAYSLTSDPDRPDGCIGITPKLVDAGKVSPVPRAPAPGPATSSGSAASKGPSSCPIRRRERLLFISAGSGITPIMAHAARPRPRPARSATSSTSTPPARPRRVIFGEQPAADRRRARRATACACGSPAPRAGSRPDDLDRLCPDWRERHAFLSGPGEMLDAMGEHWRRDGDPELLHDGALPAGDRRRRAARRRRPGAASLRERRRGRAATAARRSWSAARRPGRSCRSAAGWGSATPASASSAAARSATCAPARSTAARARWSAPASTPRKGRSRSRFETTKGRPWTAIVTETREPARPPLRGAARRARPTSSTRSTTASSPTSASATVATSRA